MRILVTGANGQVGHELLRALVQGKPSPSVPLPAEGGGRRSGFVQEPSPSVPSPAEGGRRSEALVHAPSSSIPLPAGERPTATDRYPLPQEGGRRAASGGWLSPHARIIPATRAGALEDGAACEPVDLADLAGLARALDRIAPEVIVNAAAYTAVDRAEDDAELAQRVNADAVRVIGDWAARHGARVVHYSTDYVFDGTATRPYREDDATAPLGAYGRSKLAGELALAASGARHLILRTAWVYAARGHNFLRTMLRLGAERETLRVVDDQVGAPTPAGVIADLTTAILAQWLNDGADAARDGLYHLVTTGHTSWCGFARAIFDRAQAAGVLARRPAVQAIGTRDYPTPARRPAWSVLDTGKLRRGFELALPDWQAALDGVIAELASGRV